MIDIKVDDNDNIVLENGDIAIVKDIEEIEQSLKIRLQMWLGEWFLDESLGLDFLGKIRKKNYSLQEVDKEIKRVIIETFGVVRILTYFSEVKKEDNLEKLKVKFSVSTIYSQNIDLERVLS